MIRALPLLLLLLGCSSVRVQHEADPSVDFDAYTGFAWLPRPASAPAAPASLLDSELVQRRVRETVEAGLLAKGLVRSDTPDLLVAVHRGVRDRVNVTDWGAGYDEPEYEGTERDVEAYPYREGTLILDLIDARTKAVVWRGSATGTVDEAASPEDLQEQLEDTVARLLAGYPPTDDR